MTTQLWDVIDQNLAITGNFVGLYGPPGTGKTHAAATAGLPEDAVIVQVDCADGEITVEGNAVGLFSLTMTDGASEAELRGHYIPTAEGGMWIDGPATLAWKISHQFTTRLVINEIDRASDEVLSLLYAIADDPTSPGTMVTLPNERKETVRPGKHFTVVATMNGVPEDLPEALQDRFVWIHVDEVNPKALESLPSNLREHAKNAALADGKRRISIRKWIAFARLMEHMDRETAAYTAFGRDKYRDVLDAVSVARVVTRVSAVPIGGSNQNSHFDGRFSSYEDLDRDRPDTFCGWCQEYNCGIDDAECRPLRFVDKDEFEDFVAAYGLATDDVRIEGAAQARWKASMLHRTYSKPLTPSAVENLAEIQFG